MIGFFTVSHSGGVGLTITVPAPHNLYPNDTEHIASHTTRHKPAIHSAQPIIANTPSALYKEKNPLTEIPVFKLAVLQKPRPQWLCRFLLINFLNIQ